MKFEVIELGKHVQSEQGEGSTDVLLLDEDNVVALVKRPDCVSLFAHSAAMLEFIRQVAVNQCGHRAVEGGYDEECLVCDARRMIVEIEGLYSLRLH